MVPAFLNNKGFTLIEFMVSIFILTVGLLGLLSAINLSLSRNMETQLRNEAVSVLDKEMARELSKGYNNISTSTYTYSVISHVMNAPVNYTLTRTGNMLSTSKVVNYRVAWLYHNMPSSHNASSVSSQPNM
jgi:prepilin-type N-terminal cleavage/methylation domain-containing protein